MKKLLSVIAALTASCLVLGGCGGTPLANGSESGPGLGSDDAYSPAPDEDSDEDSDISDGEWGDSAGGSAGGTDPSAPEGGGAGSGNQQVPIVKQLTAAEWRDAYNYDFWTGLFEKDVPFKGQDGIETTRDGIFSRYAKTPRGLDTFDMHEVYVTCNEAPVAGAQVTLYNENSKVFSAVTDSTGTAYVFGNGTYIGATSGQYSAGAQVSESVTEISLDDYSPYSDELEIMFVVDTTGSMGDELSFLCDELAGIVTRVSSSISCNIRLGLLFYRDKGDAYVTKQFDFVSVNSSNGLNTVVNTIKAQRSSGGGDYPEAVDTALDKAVGADWHENSKTKLLFHVLDAPYHDEQESQSVFANAVCQAAAKGIRIIPVAASGLDTLGQYIMRSAALLTGGTYTFLTDDSGIGGHHNLPAVGDFTVEYLSDLIVRLINGYYTGTFEEPVHWSKSESIA